MGGGMGGCMGGCMGGMGGGMGGWHGRHGRHGRWYGHDGQGWHDGQRRHGDGMHGQRHGLQRPHGPHGEGHLEALARRAINLTWGGGTYLGNPSKKYLYKGLCRTLSDVFSDFPTPLVDSDCCFLNADRCWTICDHKNHQQKCWSNGGHHCL